MTLDTLQIYEQLRSSNLPDEAAKGIANVIKNVTESELANKTDVAEIFLRIEQLRKELKQDIEQLRKELKQDIEYVRSDLEMAKIESRREIAETKVEIIKWVAGMIVAQGVVIAALVKLL